MMRMNKEIKWDLFIVCLWFLFLIIQLFYEGNTKDALFIVTLSNFITCFYKTVRAAYEE